mmetsp:Transcript_4724/g.11430  ORF Transcript_4724/g.11430 Transcript_4724/m.11430 type:complete len:391 (+) Transcript_4724:2036-3208(+)
MLGLRVEATLAQNFHQRVLEAAQVHLRSLGCQTTSRVQGKHDKSEGLDAHRVVGPGLPLGLHIVHVLYGRGGRGHCQCGFRRGRRRCSQWGVGCELDTGPPNAIFEGQRPRIADLLDGPQNSSLGREFHRRGSGGQIEGSGDSCPVTVGFATNLCRVASGRQDIIHLSNRHVVLPRSGDRRQLQAPQRSTSRPQGPRGSIWGDNAVVIQQTVEQEHPVIPGTRLAENLHRDVFRLEQLAEPTNAIELLSHLVVRRAPGHQDVPLDPRVGIGGRNEIILVRKHDIVSIGLQGEGQVVIRCRDPAAIIRRPGIRTGLGPLQRGHQLRHGGQLPALHHSQRAGVHGVGGDLHLPVVHCDQELAGLVRGLRAGDRRDGEGGVAGRGSKPGGSLR